MKNVNPQHCLAQFLVDFPSASIGKDAHDIARQSLLDTLAVSFAGGAETASRLAANYVLPMRQSPGAIAWLSGEQYLPEAAALFNAVAAHALDYDDVTPAWRGHPGTVIWPALYAVSQTNAVTFGELLDAYVLGYEVGAQIGANITAHHYKAGWHATCTIGILAAAAACSRALKFDARQTSDALGLAVAQSAGLQANFGSLAKPFQAGFASSGAVRATLLAKAGIHAADNALDGPASFGSLYGATEAIRLELPMHDAAHSMSIARLGIEIKQFPNCYATHRAIEATLSLRARIGAGSEQIRAITIEGTPGAHEPLLDRAPATVDEARFSMEFGVACALADGALQLGSFTTEALERPDIRRLMSTTRVQESLRSGAKRSARVSIELVNGMRLAEIITDLPGRFDQSAFMQRLAAKVSDCMRHASLYPHSQALLDETLTASLSSDYHLMTTKVFKAIFSARYKPSTH